MTDSDRAKTARVLRAVPLEAPWREYLASGRSLHRIPVWVQDAAFDAKTQLDRDVVDFIDPELAKAFQGFTSMLAVLLDEFTGTFIPLNDDARYTEVPPEWKRTRRDDYYKALEDLSAARQGVLRHYKELVNTMNSKGQIPGLEDPAARQSIQVSSGDNSPVSVIAPQAHALHGGTANAHINPPSTAPGAPPIPWWNRSIVLWTALGAVAAVAGALAAVLALYK